VRQWKRTLERERSFYDFRKQVNLVERTWYDDLRAMPELSGFCESFSHPYKQLASSNCDDRRLAVSNQAPKMAPGTVSAT